jgi:mannose-6-phosphate isomerase-like protein (cupin superfamily)
MIEGELEHSLGDQLFHLRAGMSIFIPQGVGHDASNRGSVTARMVVGYPTGDRQIVMLEAGDDR